MSAAGINSKSRAKPMGWLSALIAACFVATLLLPNLTTAAGAYPTAPPQVWKLKRTRVLVDWPNANLGKDPVISASGGEGDVIIRGYGEVCPGQSEHIRFNWSFINKDVTVVRPGEDIEVNLKTKRISGNNPCGGGLTARSYLTIIPSGSSGLTGTQDERFLSKKLGRAGGDPNGDAASASITVNTGQSVSVPAASFALRFSGPCATGYSCGVALFVYEYELTTVDGRGISVELSTDRPGLDYRNFDLPQAKYELCRDACADDPKCKAYTYVKPGVQGPNARCWLKSSVPPARSGGCCVSGLKP